MNVNLTDSEKARIETLAERLDEPTMRAVPKAARPKLIVLRAIELGLAQMEAER